MSEDVRGHQSAISGTRVGEEGGKKGLESIITAAGLLVAAQHHSSYCHPLPFNNTIQLCYCFYVFLFFVCCNFILWSSDYQHHYQIVGHGQTSGWNLEGHQGISQIEIWGLSGWNRYWSSSCYITHLSMGSCFILVVMDLYRPLMFCSKITIGRDTQHSSEDVTLGKKQLEQRWGCDLTRRSCFEHFSLLGALNVLSTECLKNSVFGALRLSFSSPLDVL